MRARLLSSVASALRQPATVPLHFTRFPAPQPPASPGKALPPVLMVHGVLASESTYRSIMSRPDFVPAREKIGIDLRNHGKSPHVGEQLGMAYEDMSADLASLLDDEGIPSACIIGHSMGGKVAMQFALSHPEKVSELVVVDIAPVNYTPGKDSGDPYIATQAMRAVDLRTCDTRAKVDAELLRNGVKSEAVRQFAMTNLLTNSDGGEGGRYRWKVNLAGIEAAFPDIMSFPDQQGRSYQGPTCLIRGGKSKYVPFETMRVFTSLFPRTKLVTISEAGHWLQAQYPDDFCRSVNDFLGE